MRNKWTVIAIASISQGYLPVPFRPSFCMSVSYSESTSSALRELALHWTNSRARDKLSTQHAQHPPRCQSVHLVRNKLELPRVKSVGVSMKLSSAGLILLIEQGVHRPAQTEYSSRLLTWWRDRRNS